jgi:serine/threonine-protein kinase
VEKLAAGGYHTCAPKQGKVYCWGYNSWGQASVASPSVLYTPLAVAGLNNATDLAVGNARTCVVQLGRVYCWGFGRGGELGSGSNLRQSSPTHWTQPMG